jgi:hypothetical protein
VTCVYGVGKAPQKIAEGVDAFLQRIGVAAHFFELTRPNDTAIWVNGAAVNWLTLPMAGEYPPDTKTMVAIGSLTQAVQQDLAAVRALVNSHGGDL